MFDTKNLSLIGKGIYSKVYLLSEDSVLKVSNDETDGFHIIPHLSKKVIETFSLVRVDVGRSYVDEGQYVMEHLYPLDCDFFDGTELAITILNDLHENPKLKGRFKDYINNTHPLYDMFCKAERLLLILRRSGYGVCLDINQGNIMSRKNGELVFNDPFGLLDI